jgi:general secretion pathway protein E
MRLLVHRGANDTDVRRLAEKGGMINMRADAQRWIKSGVTSQEEALRVTREG